jgi:kynurenine formamidase
VTEGVPSGGKCDRADSKVPSEARILAWLDELSNAGRWGPDDELGTLNLIGPDERLAAIRTVEFGRVLSLGKDLDTVPSATNPTPPLHRMLTSPGEAANAAFDIIEIAPHSLAVTHLDAVAHMSADGRIYNARVASDVFGAGGLAFGSIHAQREGIVTRAVLLDVPASQGLPWLADDARIEPNDLDRAEAYAAVRVRRGDALIVRVGVGAREAELGREDPRQRAGMMPGCLHWLRDREVALFGGDCYDAVPLPYGRIPAPFHQLALAVLGMPFLDSMAVEEVATVCAELGRWEFLLVVAPLRVIGGTGSPVNPLAIF